MEQKKVNCYRIKIESQPGGSADVYVNGEFVKHFEGKHSIEEAANYIDVLREEQNRA